MVWGPRRPDQFQERLLQELRSQGVLTPRLEAAMRRHPRHHYFSNIFVQDEDGGRLATVPPNPARALLARIYRNEAILTRRPRAERGGDPSSGLSSSTQPSLMCLMIHRLALHTGQQVLEIGTGTGWNAALMAALVEPDGRVITMENQVDVAEQARRHLARQDVENVRVVTGDGSRGWPQGAPYDRIMVTAGCYDVAPAWHRQLAPDGGRILLPLELGGGLQLLLKLQRAKGEPAGGRFATAVSFMRLQPGDETPWPAPHGESFCHVPPLRPRSVELGLPLDQVEMAGFLFYLFLAFGAGRRVVQDGRPAAFGLEGDDGSLALIRIPPTHALVYGDSGALEQVEDAVAAWEGQNRPELQDFYVTISPQKPAGEQGREAVGGPLDGEGPAGPWSLCRAHHLYRVRLDGGSGG